MNNLLIVGLIIIVTNIVVASVLYIHQLNAEHPQNIPAKQKPLAGSGKRPSEKTDTVVQPERPSQGTAKAPLQKENDTQPASVFENSGNVTDGKYPGNEPPAAQNGSYTVSNESTNETSETAGVAEGSQSSAEGIEQEAESIIDNQLENATQEDDTGIDESQFL